MWPNRSSAFPLRAAILGLALAPAAPAADRFWVQSVQADLKAGPQLSAAAVAHLQRGDEVSVTGKKDFWLEATAGRNKGWVSKLFLTDHPPVGSADLSKEVQTSMEKTSRKRSSSYAVSASTRGFRADRPFRRNGAERPADYASVLDLEQLRIDPRTLAEFVDEAKGKAP